MSQLTEPQTQLLHDLVAQGLSLGQIQTRLGEEGVTMTYMDLRFLLDDMGLSLAEKEAPKVAPTDDVTKAVADEAPVAGELSIEVDSVVRPGALASGSVVFSDGVKASWMLDQMGRLGLTDAPDGYQPSQTDLADFQVKLRGALESRTI